MTLSSSLRYGNKAKVWEELIDQKKLPYLATIRNLRNLVLAGIDDAHVDKVCSNIRNEKAVANSRMFPHRFYTAFDVLNELRTMCDKKWVEPKKAPQSKKGAGADNKYDDTKRLVNKMKRQQEVMNKGAIEKFEKALEGAVLVATRRNIPPMKGSTLILCATGQEMRSSRLSRAIKGKLNRGSDVQDVALLFALMAHTASEESDLLTYNAGEVTREFEESSSDELKSVSLLENVRKLRGKGHNSQPMASSLARCIRGHLMEVMRREAWFDTVLVVHGETPGEEVREMLRWTDMYRELVNPGLIYADVNVCGDGSDSENFWEDDANAKNIFMCGFSESIFQILANTGGSGSLSHLVDTVDRKYKLGLNKRIGEMQTLPVSNVMTSNTGNTWRRVKLFVSSTFADMHGERHILNTYVFPSLIKAARMYCIDLVPVDLR